MTSSQNTTGLFKVVRASAGSGKTYSLVKEFLLLALKTKSADYYKHILAITFTNAAAAEMKERVIHRLQELAENNDTKNSLLNELVQKLNISPDEVQARSAATYKHILHNYSQLSIQTIDGFTHKLIRAFARELKLNQDFSVEMDLDAFIELLADKCLDSIGHDKEITRYLELFALENLEEGSSWNIRSQLVNFSKQLLKEDAHDALDKLSHLHLDDFRNIRKRLFEKQKAVESQLKSLGEKGIEIMTQHGLQPLDFSYGKTGGMMVFAKLSNENFEYPSNRFFDLLGSAAWYSKTAKPEIKSAIDSLHDDLHKVMQHVSDAFSPEAYGVYRLRDLILKNIYVIGLLNELNELAKGLKEENNMLLISDFHQLVNEVVRESPAPFIYERIGNRYKHILIDEFQDTSALQWANAVPLIQNTLGENNMSLLVGDAKQSIYRWRGGRVEQFVNLPKVDVKTSFANSHSFFASHFAEEILENNFRSARSIIDFNNRFYNVLAPALGNKSTVYDKQAQQVVKTLEGYVQIDSVEGKNAEERWEQTSSHILSYIEQCITDGYRPCDIAILTRKGNSEGAVIANFLAENGFEVVTQGSFSLNNSAQVRTVMAYLNYLADPQKHFAAVEFVQSLQEIHSTISMEEFVQGYINSSYRKVEINLDGFIDKHFPKTETNPSSIYSIAIDTIQRFQLKIDVYIESLLDHIRDRTIARNMSLPALLEWWNTQKEKIFIASTAGENAIRIMTIHKSKGLQFPVVIYPRFVSKAKVNQIWIETDEEETGLPTALVNHIAADEAEDETVAWPQEFYEETAKNRLDDMNLCYVATTRAEERLYMIVEKAGKGSWLSAQIETTLDSEFASDKTESQWTFGKQEKTDKKTSTEQIAVIAASTEKPKQLNVRAVRIGDDFSEEIIQGNIIHHALAEVQGASSIEKAVERVVTLRQLNTEQATKLKEEVSAIVSQPQFKNWFNDSAEAISEREICTPTGRIIRPDRVVVLQDHIAVIDFKTGKPYQHHEDQVAEYVHHLKDLYSLPVRGYILYTQDRMANEIKGELDT